MSAPQAQVFMLPDLGEGLTEAEVLRWLVAVGDTVEIDQAIVEVETAKSIVELPSPYAGTVAVLHGSEGDTVEVGRPLFSVAAAAGPGDTGDAEAAGAEVYREEEKAGSGNVLIGYGTPEAARAGRRRRRRTGASAQAAPAAEAGTAPVEAVRPAPVDQAPAPAPREPRQAPKVVSPLVRALIRESGLELARIEPTGAGGVITRADVQRASSSQVEVTTGRAAPAPEPSPVADGERRVALSGFRRAVSATLSRSRAEIPEATVWVDVDATVLWDLRESARTAQAPGPGLMAYLARFVVAGLREYPALNARLDTERQEIVELASINLGIAVQSERGLVVPAVMGAERMTTALLDEEIRAVTRRAREGRSSQQELTAGTFTLNNYGSFNVDGSAAIINHPQVAILGFGRIIDRAWVVDGQVVPRKITQMSFVFDHRVCDGGTAAGFMRSVADAVENPAAAIARL